MIVLLGIDTEQEISVYVRSNKNTSGEYDITIKNEETDSETDAVVTGIFSDGLLTFPITYNFIKQRFYTIRIYDKDSGNLINFSKIYATDQTDFPKYDVIEGWYTQIEKPIEDYIVKQ